MDLNNRLRSGRRVARVAALALIVAACGRGAALETTPEGAAPDTAAPGAPAEATTYAVGVDGTTDEFNGSFHRFFPRQLTVHPGDTIVFQRPENGEPHTVTLGTAAPTSDAGPVFGDSFFDGGFGGPPRTDTSMPCFLAEGSPPSGGCTSDQQEPMPFDGTQSWFNSGGLLGEEEFTLQLAEDIAPGKYTFVCLAHVSEGMKGTIEVVGPGQEADDPADVEARGEDELDVQVGLLRPLVERPPTSVEGKVEAARVEGGSFAAWANLFFPEEIEIPVGGTVTWEVRNAHTVAFNAPESASPILERAEDGSLRFKPLGAEPSGDPSSWDGTGFLNSGFLEGLFPPDEFSVTFTRPGTYSYQCLVHSDMEGKVKVVG